MSASFLAVMIQITAHKLKCHSVTNLQCKANEPDFGWKPEKRWLIYSDCHFNLQIAKMSSMNQSRRTEKGDSMRPARIMEQKWALCLDHASGIICRLRNNDQGESRLNSKLKKGLSTQGKIGSMIKIKILTRDQVQYLRKHSEVPLIYGECPIYLNQIGLLSLQRAAIALTTIAISRLKWQNWQLDHFSITGHI